MRTAAVKFPKGVMNKSTIEIYRTATNTKYAPMARELLRDMPESRRKRYNITDWELGLRTQTTEENQR